jgi:sigma-B regulation protein RsbU (phosphoserine phosphatase)
MTLCYAIYDAKTRLLKFSNSGVPPPIICKQGKVSPLSAEGFPLGMFDAAEYQEREVVIEPGDCLVLYTDGLVETRDVRGEEFGYERLEEVLEKNYRLKAKKVIESIFAQIEKFSLDNRKLDDQTIVVLKADEGG